MNHTSAEHEARRRIVVIVYDEPGSLAFIAEALGEDGINIEMIDGKLAGEFGVITLSTDDDDAALRALLKADLRAVTTDALVFWLPDKPGALAQVASLFGEHNLNVRTIHILHRLSGHAVVAVKTDNDALARSLLDSDSLI